VKKEESHPSGGQPLAEKEKKEKKNSN